MAASREPLPAGAKIYIATTVLAASASVAWLSQRGLAIGALEAFVIMTLTVIALESLQLQMPYHGQNFKFSMGSPFLVATLTIFGVVPGVVVAMMASCVSDLLRRRSPTKVLFNVSQFTVTMTVTGLSLEALLGERITYPGMSFGLEQIPGLLIALTIFFVSNNLITGLILKFAGGQRFVEVIERFFGQEALIEGSSLILVPLIAITMQRNPVLALLLAIPVAALYRATKLALENVNLEKQRELAREEKRAAERRARSLIENSADPICLVNPSAQVIYTGSSIQGMIGEVAPAIPWDLLRYVEPDDRWILLDGLSAAARSATSIALDEIRFTQPDASVKWARIVVSQAVADASIGGSPQGFVLNIHDVSESRKLEEQLRRSQKLDAVGQLAGGIAHDFNNLLSVIQGFARFAQEAEPGDPSYREDLEEVLKTSERGVRLVRQLLMFSRKEASQAVLVDVNETITDLLKLLRTTVTESVDLLLEAGGSLPPVEIDPGELEQVLVNLAVNARDAMGHRGRLTISTALVDEGETAWVRLRVSDTGSGMSAEVLEHIFEPFFTTKERGTGTGLGLATVYGIVTGARGRIDVDSTLGIGTTFTIDLPAASGDPSREEHASARPIEGGTETILVVEDDVAVCAVAERILLSAGYDVIASHSPEAALELIGGEQRHIDLLLADVVMPGMSGPKLAQNVLSEAPNTKVLYMSGYTDDLVAKHHVSSEPVRLLRKPFSPEKLLTSVRQALAENA